MRVSVSWLKNYVDIPVDNGELAEDLTMLGLNVEHREGGGLTERKVVVGHVLDVQPHPNADKLRLCRVDVGTGEELAIVCGAPNVAAGQKVPVALVGARLPGGLKIRKSKIRGEVSNGMICSAIELGVGDEADGIMVLDKGLEIGAAVADILEAGDEVFDIEVTPNRPDQLSHIGVAREIAALYETALKPPVSDIKDGEGGNPSASIAITNPDDCYRFFGRVIRGVKVGPSPEWLRAALERVGVNSINNIVDVTNYVMMEMGQPMHAYDLSKLGSARMGVRRARDGEKLLALDDREYELEGHYMVITEGEGVVGIAGVIGGKPTSVSDATVDLFLESAAFNPRVIRATRRSMNISTEASYRFERGSDREICRLAADRATQLMTELAGGEAGECLDVFPSPWEERLVEIRKSAARRLLGSTLGTDELSSLLARLGLETVTRDDAAVTVSVPSWRNDIVEEADLIEEVARLYGYDKIGAGHAFRTTTHTETDPFADFVDAAATHLAARGHTEILTSSFTSEREVDLSGWPEGDRRGRPIPVMNPLTANHGLLRTSLLTGVLGVIHHNQNYGFRTMNLFEIGGVFLPRNDSDGLPEEPRHLLIARTRSGEQDFWRNTNQPTDLYDIKEEIECLADALRVDLGDLTFEFDTRTGAFAWEYDQNVLIEGGVVGGRLAEAYNIEQAIWYADINLTALFARSERIGRYRPTSEFPSSRRDLSLVAEPGVTYDRIEKTLVKHAGRLLESVHLFDVYRGVNLPEGRTAYGVRLHFRSNEATLVDADVDAIVRKVIAKLGSELGVQLRS